MAEGFSFGRASATIGLDTTDFEQGVKRIGNATNILDQQFKRTQQLMKVFGADSESVMNKVVQSFDAATLASRRNADEARRAIEQNNAQIETMRRMVEAGGENSDELVQQIELLQNINRAETQRASNLDNQARAYAQNAASARQYAESLQELTAREAALYQAQQRSSFDLKGPDLQGGLSRYAGNTNGLLKGQTPTEQQSFVPNFGNGADEQQSSPLSFLQNAGPAGILGAALGPAGAIIATIGVALNQWLQLLGRIGRTVQSIVQPMIELHDIIKVSSGLFTGMAGSLQQSVQITKTLRQYASETGLGFENTVEAARMIFPAMKRAGDGARDLTKYLDTMRRLAVLGNGPTGGISGAAIAISEAIASGGNDVRSLERRFNISRTAIKQFIKEANGDVITGLQNYLDNVGVTKDATDAMASTFQSSVQRLSDAFNSLGELAIRPLLDKSIIPFINNIAHLVNLFVQLEDSSHVIGNLLLLGSNLSTKGFAGIAGGTVVPGNPSAPSGGLNPLVIFSDYFKSLALGVAFVETTLNGFAIVTNNVTKAILSGLQVFYSTLASVMNSLGFSTQANKYQEMANSISGAIAQFDAQNKAIQENNAQLMLMALSTNNLKDTFDDLNTQVGGGGPKIAKEGSSAGAVVGISDALTALSKGNLNTQLEAIQRLAKILNQRAQIDELVNTEEKALQEKRDAFASDESNRWFDYLKGRARAQEDFDKERDNASTKLSEDIAAADSNLADKRTDIQNNLDQDIAKIQENAQKDQERSLAEHQRKMQQMQRDHQERLQDAAAHLDAISFIKEQENANREEQQAEDSFQAEQQQRANDVQDRIAQAKDEATQKLSVAQREHDQQIAALRARYVQEDKAARDAFALKQQREADDYATEAERRKQQFLSQLNAEIASYQQRLTELQNGLAQLTGAENTGAQARLAAVQNGNAQITAAFQNMISGLVATAGGTPVNNAPPGGGGTIGSGGGGGSGSITTPVNPPTIDPGTGQPISGGDKTEPLSKYSGAWQNFDLAFGSSPKLTGEPWITKWFEQQFTNGAGRLLNENALSFYQTYHYRPDIPSYHIGTSRVPRSGLYNLMGGEAIIPADVNRSVRGMLGSNYTHQNLLSAVQGTRGNHIEVHAPITIGQVNGIEDFEQKMAVVADEVIIARLKNFEESIH